MKEHEQLKDALYLSAAILFKPLDVHWISATEATADGWRVKLIDGKWHLADTSGFACCGPYANPESAVVALMAQVAQQRYRDAFEAQKGRSV